MPINRSLSHYLLLTLLLVISSALRAEDTDPTNERLNIFAAASLSDVLPKLMTAWRSERDASQTSVSFAASAILARQIEAGAPADVLLSANSAWVDYLTERATAFNEPAAIVHNALVLAAPCHPQTDPVATSDLGAYLANNRFAMADPAVAPAGQYAKLYLESRGLWQTARANAAYAGNARLALLLIERGGMPGIVYASDVRGSANSCTLLELPLGKNETVTYFALARSGHQMGADFVNWLKSPAAASIWNAHGFKTVSY